MTLYIVTDVQVYPLDVVLAHHDIIYSPRYHIWTKIIYIVTDVQVYPLDVVLAQLLCRGGRDLRRRDQHYRVTVDASERDDEKRLRPEAITI